MSDEARNAPTASPERSVAGASTRITILEVVFAYGLFASAWILFSDSTLRKLIHDPDRLMFASTIKGWVFVGVTSLLLYLLMRRMVQRLGPTARDPAPSLRPFIWIVPLLLAFVGVGAVAAAGALLTYHQEAGKDYARLQAVTELKASQVASWMEERLADSRFLHSSSHWANLFRRVQAGDRASLEQLVTRMEEYRVHHRYGALLILDSQARLAIATGEPGPGVTPELRAAALRASIDHQVRSSVSASLDGAPPRIEFLVPLPASPDEPAPVLALIPEPAISLFPALAAWPSPGERPAISLVRHEGSDVQRLPVDGTLATGPIAADVLERTGTHDSSDGRAAATARVSDSDWAVVAMLDRDEMLAEARSHAIWIGLAAAFGLFALATAGFVHRQRHQLRYARLHQREQSEKLEALSRRISAEEALRASNEQKDRLARELERHRDNLGELVEERTRELERMVANLETFNYTISHDLRAPLRAINGFAAVLSATERPRLSPEGERLLDRVRSCSERMDRLLNDILEYSRVDRAEPLRTPVDLKRIADEVVRDFAPGFPDAQVVVDALPVVQADATMMRQVFSNLIGNALKFSAGQATPRVEVGFRPGERHVEVFVRDNGAGFDMRYAGKLFKIFQRVHSDSEFPGTGVGLAIVKRLVEHHGGEVHAESRVGEGATFFISLATAP